MPDQRVALVTGAGRGIGRTTAIHLSRAGYSVFAVSRTEDQLRALAAEVPGIEYLAESVATTEGCERIVAAARERLGRIDVLVNNAGMGSMEERPIYEQPRDVWYDTIATNLHSAFEITRLATREMIERRWGRVVMVSSTAGRVGAPSMSAYCASKHAVVGLVRAAAHDLGPFEITCNAVLPGWVDTKLTRDAVAHYAARDGRSEEDIAASLVADYPAKRMVTEDEVAATITFLASDAASGINGEAIAVSLGSVW